MAEINVIKVEAAAHSLLERYGIKRPGFSVEDVVAAEDIEIERGPLRNVDAWLVRLKDGRGKIRIRDDIVESGRFRFSLGHELGHWEMHPTLSQGFLCTASDFTDYAQSAHEAEANTFAANFLMPRQWMRPETWKGDPSLEMISKLAKDFGTTLTAASRRFAELSNRGVVIVFSASGRVQWTVKSSRAKAVYIPYGSDIPIHSLTRECLEKQKTPSEPEAVDLNTWLPTWRVDEDSELFEDVRISQKYGWAITLLWIPELG